MVKHVNVGREHVLRRRKLKASFVTHGTMGRLVRHAGSGPSSVSLIVITAAATSCRFPSATSVLYREMGLGGTFTFSVRTIYDNFLCTLRAKTGFVHSKGCGGIVMMKTSGVSSIVSCASHTAYPVFNSNTTTFVLRPAQRSVKMVSTMLEASKGNLPFLRVGTKNSMYTPSCCALSGQVRCVCRRKHAIFGCTITGVTSTYRTIVREGRLTGRSVS